MRAFVFPGQGSQSVGMGKALADASPVARELFQEVDDALSFNLFRLMTQGPEDQLTLTENAQPAIMANAIATLRVMQRDEPIDWQRVRAGLRLLLELDAQGAGLRAESVTAQAVQDRVREWVAQRLQRRRELLDDTERSVVLPS